MEPDKQVDGIDSNEPQISPDQPVQNNETDQATNLTVTGTTAEPAEPSASQSKPFTINAPLEVATAPVDPADAMPPTAPVKAQRKNKLSKKTLAIALCSLVIVVVVGFLAIKSFSNKDGSANQSTSPKTTASLMGAEISIADGGGSGSAKAQISQDNQTWQDLTVGNQIKQGDYVKTADSGRVVIALDDGSAIRINSNSVVKIDSLDPANVVITNVSGTIYTRLVESNRKFSVNVDNEDYIAMGTAYMTINTDSTKGVEVYESAVKVNTTGTSVPEGKCYYTTATGPGQTQKISDLSVDKIKQDDFLVWNYQQDKNNQEFKDKLGYLTKIDEKTDETAQASSSSNDQASQAAETSAGISLSGSANNDGVNLSWQVNNISAPKGFKVVKSASANPVYPGNDYLYLADPNARSATWDINDGKTYHFRVCTYTGSGCENYSNDITVTALGDSEEDNKQPPSGSLSLSSSGGNNFSWTLNGSAPYGYKLVWSKSPEPVYPGSSYQYLSSESDKSGSISPKRSGTYYVRVCMYNPTGDGDACVNYSNQLSVTID